MAFVDPDDYILPGVYEAAIACMSDDIDMEQFCVQVTPETESEVTRSVRLDRYFTARLDDVIYTISLRISR